jgi:hypothetical protein
LKRIQHTLVLVLLALILGSPLYAQVARVQNKPGYDYKWIHFGFMVGINTMDFRFTRPPEGSTTPYLFADISSPSPGFQVSIVSDLRLGDRFSLRFLPGITFGAREVSFYEKISETQSELIKRTIVESNYLDFPLLLKYKSWRVNNYRPYLVGGFSVRYDMARKPYEPDFNPIQLNRLDFFLELGFGIDFFLQYFKFAPEIKVSAGFMDVQKAGNTDPYNQSIEKLNAYLVMLCFYFE